MESSTLIDIAAMRFDFPVTDDEISVMAAEISAISNDYWYWCTFRESYLTCLYGNEDVNDKTSMTWLPHSKTCTKIIELCEQFVFPMTTVRPRIIVIRTIPGMKMTLHTDCYENQLNTLEPKLRLVLQGREKNMLYFVNEFGERVYIPNTWRGYVMSGAALHGMDNVETEKFTLCFGDPWIGDNLDNVVFEKYISEQHELYKSSKITISSLGDVNHKSGVKDPTTAKMISWADYNASKKD